MGYRRAWWNCIGVFLQAISTIALIHIGDGDMTNSWTTGIFAKYTTVAFALVATAIAYLIVAVGENLMFRDILIRQFTEYLLSLNIPRRGSTVIAVLSSSILYGVLHFVAGADGLSASVVILQAIAGGVYFGVAYALTDSLAMPVGIHLSTNVSTTVVFGQPGSGYPAAYIFGRSIRVK
jgi:membrane protease YdiL (CAAX protease family)